MVRATQHSDSEDEELLSQFESDAGHESLSTRFSIALTNHFAKQNGSDKVNHTTGQALNDSPASASATAGAVKNNDTSSRALYRGDAGVKKKRKSQHSRQREGVQRISTSKYRGVTRHRYVRNSESKYLRGSQTAIEWVPANI